MSYAKVFVGIVVFCLIFGIGQSQWLETTILVDDYPWDLVYNSLNNKVYCANDGSNDVTVIDCAVVRYSLPKAGQVVLKLYNVTGNLIKTYTNSSPSKDGLVLIDTKKITSGVYILRFSSGNLKAIRKLVIEK